MSLQNLSAEDAKFRDEVRAFFARELTPDLVAATDHHQSLFPPPTVSLIWQRKLQARGWLASHWPREHGGAGFTAMQRFIFDTESGLAGAPLLGPFGLNYLGPVLIHFGTDAQRQKFLPRILSGEDYWCQGYSEPNAGSDLAGLQCAARRDGDEYVVRGSKMWTTHAQYANWIFCLVRTSVEPRRQNGISFLLVDLKAKGVTVAPIISFAGEHEVNQVFFDDVRVPADNLVGAEGDGWRIARFLLEYERGGFIMNGLIRRKLERCKALAAASANAQSDEVRSLRARIAELDIDLLALEAAELQNALAQEGGGTPGPEASVLKLEFSELMQRIEATALALLGTRSLAFEHGARDGQAASVDAAIVGAYLNNRATTIYGGSSEIQRDLVARNLVGI
jgi:acyl-CoA dehydrogenase